MESSWSAHGMRLILLGAVGLLATVSGCASHQRPSDGEGQPASARVTGMVTSRVRTVLPQDALVQLELADISRVGAPGRTVALREIWTGGRQFPIPFDIPYSSAAIDSDRSYAVQVRVTQGNRLLFKNLTVYMVITNGIKSNLEVVVEPVPGSGGDPGRH